MEKIRNKIGERLEKLPPLEERLKSWTKIIEEMDKTERSILRSLSFNIIPPVVKFDDFYEEAFQKWIQVYLEKREDVLIQVTPFFNLISSFLDRLLEPIKDYDAFLSEALCKTEAYQIFKKAKEEAEAKIKFMVDQDYALALTKPGLNVKRYIADSKSMVTAFLFQCPILPGPHELTKCVSRLWDADCFVKLHHSLIEEKFKNYGADIS